MKHNPNRGSISLSIMPTDYTMWRKFEVPFGATDDQVESLIKDFIEKEKERLTLQYKWEDYYEEDYD